MLRMVLSSRLLLGVGDSYARLHGRCASCESFRVALLALADEVGRRRGPAFAEHRWAAADGGGWIDYRLCDRMRPRRWGRGKSQRQEVPKPGNACS